MTTARIIVSESSGRWTIGFRTSLLTSSLVVTEVADLDEAFGRFRDDWQSLLAFEATTSRAEQGMHQLLSSRQQCPGRSVVVLLDSPLADTASLWHEAGAAAVAASPRQLFLIARLIRRYFADLEPPTRTLREDVSQRMPWHES